VISFSEGMAMALRGTGVRMVVVCPGFVHTDFHRRVGIDQSGTPEMLWVDIDTVIDESLAGLRANRPIVVPGTVYKGVARAIKLLPRSVIRGVANRVDRGPRD
jgi:short-subunit dehydrogenase